LIELFIAYFLSRKILFFGQKGIDMDRIILFSLLPLLHKSRDRWLTVECAYDIQQVTTTGNLLIMTHYTVEMVF